MFEDTGKIKHLMYKDDIKIFVKNLQGLETLSKQ